MTQKEIHKGNKLIAEFMDAKLAADGNYIFSINFDKNWARDIASIEGMKFHCRWDWLMPVVNKILEVSWEMNHEEEFYLVRDCIPSIKTTYEAVIEFIKWYNKQKS